MFDVHIILVYFSSGRFSPWGMGKTQTMKDKDKTQKQLNTELTKLRRRIAELEASGRKRNQFEEALRTEKDKAQKYLDIAEVILVALNKKGEITLINRKGNQLLGYKEGELLGKNWFTTCLPFHIRKKIKNGFLKLMAGERQLTEFYENPAQTKSGTERIIAWHNTLLKDTQGNPIGTLSSGEDITDRKHAEKALRESEEKYRTLVEHSKNTIVLLQDKIIKFINSASVNLLGYSPNEMIGSAFLKFVHPDDQEFVKQRYSDRLAGKGVPPIYALRLLRRDGTPVWTEANAMATTLDGRPADFAFLRDITDRKQAEKDLRESEQRYRGLFEGAAEGILIADLKSKQFLYANPSMCNMLGYSEEELGNLSVRDIHPSESLKHVISEFKAQGSGEKTLAPAIPCVRKDGTILYTDITTSKILIGGKECNVGFFTDITDRKRAEEELRESEVRFRTLFEAIPDTVLVHNDEGTILHINEIGAQRLEWSAKDLVGRNLREIVTSENAASIADHVRETHKVGWSRFETTYVSRSGWQIMSEVYEHPIKFGKEKAVLSVARDITERKKADETLREREETIRALVESSQDWIWSIDVQGMHTYSNPAVEKILGYTPRDLIGKSSLKLMHEEDRRAVEANLTRWIKEKSGWQNIILRWRHKDGSWRWLESNAVPICDVTGELIGFRGVDRDITERKQTEKALLKEKHFSDTVMDSSPGLFFVFDDKGNILRWNRNVEKVTEYSTQEISKMNVLDFVVQEDKKSATETIQEALNKGQASVEITILSKSGKKIPFYLTGLRTHIENITCVVGSGFDITERKETEEALQGSYDQLQEIFISAINALASTVEMKDQYSAGHQLRVAQLSCAIAEEMGLSKDQIEGIRMAGLIHDIGKIVVPAEILNKPGPLTEVQYEMIKMHPQAGHDILKRIAFPWPVAQIVQQHHERIDGSGYPQGLSGEGILPEARIMAVANVVAAMTAHRPYRPAYDIEEALAEISHDRGTKYDSAVVDACLRLFTKRGFVFDSAQY